MLEDYYNVLGVSRSATQVEIKAAFRSLAKNLHPDRHMGDSAKEEALKNVNEAYSILSNIEKKMAYDKRLYLQAAQAARTYTSSTTSTTYTPSYTSPNPAAYAPRKRAYATADLVYSKWTLMYGKIFVVLLIMFVTLFPVMLEYTFSVYYYNVAMGQLEQGKIEDALDNFGHAMRDMGGRSTEAAIEAAEISLGFNRNYEVLSYTRLGLEYVEKRADKARLLYFQGVARSNLFRHAEAEESLTAALNLNFNSDSVYNELAPIYAYQLNKYSKALSTYDSLMLNHPDDIDNYLHRGFCQQKLGRHAEAVADFNYFLSKKGPNGSAYYLKGISQISLLQTDSACINFNKAMNNGVPNAAAFLLLNCESEKKPVETRG